MSGVDGIFIGDRPACEVLDELFASIKEKDSEIDRLNAEYSALQKNYDTLWRTQYAEIDRLKEENENYARIVEGLRRRAREATKDANSTQ